MHIALLMIAVMLLALTHAILHDRLLLHQYTYHRAAWEEDGFFGGLFWHVRGAVSSIQVEGFAPPKWGRTYWLWVFRTPSWVDEQPSCRRSLYAYRCATVVHTLAFFVVVVVTVISQVAK
jgi:hypothetical protein